MKSISKLQIQNFCLWEKIKKELKLKGIKGKDKRIFKEKIGYNLIEDNKLCKKELEAWSEIFNSYKQKLSLFYEYAKSLKAVFCEIKEILGKLQDKVQLASPEFMSKIALFVGKFGDNSEFKEILELFTYEIFTNETVYKDYICFPKSEDIDIEHNLENIDKLTNALIVENIHYMEEANKLRDILDKMTDLCENSAILDTHKLNKLKEYLESHQNFIVKNLNTIYKAHIYLFILSIYSIHGEEA